MGERGGLGNRRLRNVALSTLEIPYIEGSIQPQTGDPAGELEQDSVQFPCIPHPGVVRVFVLGLPGGHNFPNGFDLPQALLQLLRPSSDPGCGFEQGSVPYPRGQGSRCRGNRRYLSEQVRPPGDRAPLRGAPWGSVTMRACMEIQTW